MTLKKILQNIDLNLNKKQGTFNFKGDNISTIYDKHPQNLSTFRNKVAT